MPKFHFQEKVNSNVKIGVQLRKAYTPEELETKGKWSAIVRFKGMKEPHIESLGIRYANGAETYKYLAKKKAEEIGMEVYQRNKKGDASQKAYIRILTAEWIEETRILTEANEDRKANGLAPIHEVKGGRGYWDTRTHGVYERICNNYLYGFYKTLNTGRDEADIRTIAPQDLDTITKYVLDNPSRDLRLKGRDASPSLILKIITVLRHIHRYAYDKKIIDRVPQIQRPKTQMLERARRPLTDDEYRRMVEWSRERYQSDEGFGEFHYRDDDGNLRTEKVDTYRDYQYLFHLWILVIANCGIRPPTSGTEHTMMKWSHYHYNEKTNSAVLERPNEKGKPPYKAVVMREAIPYWDALRKFQEDRGIYRPDGYVFAHPIGMEKRARGWKKGEPIKNFRKQWKTMLEELGLDAPSNALGKDRLVPYSLRSYFITKRLEEGGVDIHKLANSTGTSIDVIMAHYYKFQTEKEYEELVKGGYKRPASLKPKYNEHGYYIGHEEG